MDWFQLVILIVILLLMLSWLLASGQPRGLPPGPRGLPLLGYFPFLGRTPHTTLANLGKKYSGVFTLPVFNQYAIVLSDWPSIKEALVHQTEIFSGRPPTFMTSALVDNTDISLASGIGWRERRRFTLRHLKDFTFEQKSMEVIIVDEVNAVLDIMQSMDHRKVDVQDLSFVYALNVVWSFVGGKRYDHNDKRTTEFSQILYTIFNGLSIFNVINFIPMLRHLPGSGFSQYQRANEKLCAFLKEEIEAHVDTFQEGHARDFIDAYLAESHKLQEQNSPTWIRSFQEQNLKSVLWDLFLAGIETTSNTLLWGLLYMIIWPDIQRKVQQEMDDVIGRARLPTNKDLAMLPYTKAVLLEVDRWCSLVPMSLMHYTEASTTLCGFTIPKSAVILENIWAVHHDPELWGDPEVFRPERFMNTNGQVQIPEYFIPFSVGSRMCIGIQLARMEVSLAFTSMLHRFSFSVVSGEKLPSIEPQVALTLKPWPFSMTIRRR